MDIVLYTLPLIGALIGYITNYLAIKMLFHPRYPVIILGMRIQGVFPRRQTEFGQKLGHLIATELLSVEELTHRLQERAHSAEFMDFIGQRIQQILLNKLPQHYPAIVFLLGSEVVGNLTKLFREDIEQLLQDLIVQLREEMNQEINIQAIVAQKVANFDVAHLERIILEVMSKEFQFVEWVGAVLGFLIGLCQLGLLLL